MKRNTKHHVATSVGCSTGTSQETHCYFCVSQKEWLVLVGVSFWVWEEVWVLVECERPYQQVKRGEGNTLCPESSAEPFLASGHQWRWGCWLRKTSWNFFLHWLTDSSGRSLCTDIIQFHSTLPEKDHSISGLSNDFFYVFKVRKSRLSGPVISKLFKMFLE